MFNPPIWDGVLRRLGDQMPAFALEAWLQPLVAESDDDGLRLVCPSAFHRDRLRDRWLERIARSAEAEAGRPVRVELCVRAGGAAAAARATGAPPEPSAAPAADATGRPPLRASRMPLDRERAPERSRAFASSGSARGEAQRALPYRFESFVVGPCNALAREASFALAHGRQLGVSPLFLAASPGLGKTHLARAIAGEAQEVGGERVVYASCERFTSELMTALRAQKMQGFKKRYRQECDLLVIEDVQFLRGKIQTQLELFHTVEHLLDAGARIVLTADRMPKSIPDLDTRLGSWMTSGLVAEMEAPDARIRREILRRKAADGGVRLPEDCLELLVERVRGSVRDLEGALIQLVSSASLLKRPIDLALTEAAVQKIAPSTAPEARLVPETVIAAVATFFKTTPAALAARSRRRDVLVPRQLAMYLCRRYTDASLQRIGDALGREHPAVSHAIGVVEREILERAPLRYQVEALCARLDALVARGGGKDAMRRG